MQILVSGHAGAFAVRNGDAFDLYRAELNAPIRVGGDVVSRVFERCGDVREMRVGQIAEAKAVLARAANADRAIRLFTMLLDPEEPSSELQEIASALEKILQSSNLIEPLEQRFLSHELPIPIDYSAIDAAVSTMPNVQGLFHRIIGAQDTVKRVRLALVEALSIYKDLDDRLRALARAIGSGAARRLVLGLQSGEVDDGLVFGLLEDVKGAPDSIALVNRWVAPFRAPSSTKKIKTFEEEVEDDPDWEIDGPDARRAYENARTQQHAVLERLDAGEIENARNFARQLAEFQLQNGPPEYAAKSLTKLSQAAKEREYYDLQLEWALLARDAYPSDPRTHGQVADAYVMLGRYSEAQEAFSAASDNGDPYFAVTGRARMLRLQHATAEALEAYRMARDEFGSDAGGHFAWAGIAECLRDFGRLDEALQVYRETVDRFPNESAARDGYASTLAQAGRIKEAEQTYRDALDLDGNDKVAKTGLAQVLKISGRLDIAEQRFRALVGRSQRNSFAEIGLVDTLRLKGNVAQAEKIIRGVAERFPRSASARLLWAQCLKELDDTAGALKVLREAAGDFPIDTRIPAALGWLLRDTGQYEEALATFDGLTQLFPLERAGWMGRADMLRRLGRIAGALQAYDELLEKVEYPLPVKVAKASLLISQGCFAEAEGLLPNARPYTQDDWRAYLVRGMLLTRQRRQTEAVKHFEWGIRQCPFFREVRFLRSGLANIHLLRHHPQRAVEIAAIPRADIAGVVTLNAYASAGRQKDARDIFDSMRDDLPKRQLNLAEEICIRHGIIPGKSRMSFSRLFAAQTDALLLEAA